MTDPVLKKLGLDQVDGDLLERYYADLRGLLLHEPIHDRSGLYLDLDSLPTDPINFKDLFIKWLISINLGRLNAGQAPIMTVALALRCPLWRLVPAPVRRLNLTKEGVFNKPTVKTIGQKPRPGSINKG